MKKTIIGIILALGIMGCTNETATVQTLQDDGYTNIQTTGYDMFSCGKDDGTSTGFIAKGPSGRDIRGTVCCGVGPWSKGCTVRISH